jgi:hypothetical protein
MIMSESAAIVRAPPMLNVYSAFGSSAVVEGEVSGQVDGGGHVVNSRQNRHAF